MDPLQKIRRDISILIVDIDTLLEEREKIPVDSTGADVVQKKYRNQNAIENKLNQLKNEIDKFSQEITSMKKNKSKNKLNYNIQQLEDHLRNYGEQYDERRARLEGYPVPKKAKPISLNDIKNLDEILDNRKDIGPEREIYQEEKDKLDRWKNEIKEQDKQLEDVAVDVKRLKINAKDVERGIDRVGKNIGKTNNMAGKTETNLEKSNKKLKEILDKVGGPTNFCVDVVLVCVCLGLIAVLYNLIKNQTSKTTTANTNTSTTTLRLLNFLD